MRVLRNASQHCRTLPSQHNLLPDATETDCRRAKDFEYLTKHCEATIEIFEFESGWVNAYARWLTGQPPTLDKEWKSGVFLCRI